MNTAARPSVALREYDRASLHVHPNGAAGDGVRPDGLQVRFAAEVPSAGTYQLFLDFRHGEIVRTAEFSLRTAGATGPAAAPTDVHGH